MSVNDRRALLKAPYGHAHIVHSGSEPAPVGHHLPEKRVPLPANLAILIQRSLVVLVQRLLYLAEYVGHRSALTRGYLGHGLHRPYPSGQRGRHLGALPVVVVYAHHEVGQRAVKRRIPLQVALHDDSDSVELPLYLPLHGIGPVGKKYVPVSAPHLFLGE